MYQIFDSKTKQLLPKEYSFRRTANKQSDRLNNTHGSYRYITIYEPKTSPLLAYLLSK